MQHDAEFVDENGMVGVGVSFNKIRRITGYLVGDWRKRFNDAKQHEVEDRVKHFKMQTPAGAGINPATSGTAGAVGAIFAHTETPAVNMGTEIHNSDKPASSRYAAAAGA